MVGADGGEADPRRQGGGAVCQPAPVKDIRLLADGVAEEGGGPRPQTDRITGSQSDVRGIRMGRSAWEAKVREGRPARKQKSPTAHRALTGGGPPSVMTCPMCP